MHGSRALVPACHGSEGRPLAHARGSESCKAQEHWHPPVTDRKEGRLLTLDTATRRQGRARAVRNRARLKSSGTWRGGVIAPPPLKRWATRPVSLVRSLAPNYILRGQAVAARILHCSRAVAPGAPYLCSRAVAPGAPYFLSRLDVGTLIVRFRERLRRFGAVHCVEAATLQRHRPHRADERPTGSRPLQGVHCVEAVADLTPDDLGRVQPRGGQQPPRRGHCVGRLPPRMRNAEGGMRTGPIPHSSVARNSPARYARRPRITVS